MIEVNGMAHVILTVSQWEKARAFYGELLPYLGMTKVYDGNNFLYHVGGRTAVGIQRCAEEHGKERFVANRVGLHHLCLRARSREDVDKAADKVRSLGAVIDRGPLEGNWAPGYYYVLSSIRTASPPQVRTRLHAGGNRVGRFLTVPPLTPPGVRVAYHGGFSARSTPYGGPRD